jgi:hypothetical protein
MNQLLKNNITTVIALLLILHVGIGYSFLLYNKIVTQNTTYKYIINVDGRTYQSNEVYCGNNSILFFNGFKGTYESNRNTIKISKNYRIDTINNKIIIKF